MGFTQRVLSPPGNTAMGLILLGVGFALQNLGKMAVPGYVFGIGAILFAIGSARFLIGK